MTTPRKTRRQKLIPPHKRKMVVWKLDTLFFLGNIYVYIVSFLSEIPSYEPITVRDAPYAE